MTRNTALRWLAVMLGTLLYANDILDPNKNIGVFIWWGLSTFCLSVLLVALFGSRRTVDVLDQFQ